MKTKKATVLLLLGAVLAAGPLAAQEGAQFGLGLTFGAATFEDPETGELDSYQALGLQPDISIGKFGLAFDLTVNYRFTGGSDEDEFEIREEDWVPDDDTNFLELYLPKFRYVRWGNKGDELYARFGSFNDATLGNGFIVNNYSNELYLPDRRIFGAQLDVDGRLFDFPYVGIETLAGNVASFDVTAARLYARPFAGLGMPLIPGLQVGGTVAIDRDAFYFADKDPQAEAVVPNSIDTVAVYGVDLRLPVLSSDMLTMAVFGDTVFQDDSAGGMVGTSGRIARIFLYGAQVRVLDDGFIPSYFDRTYDRRRVERYAIYKGLATEEPQGHVGWLAYTGLAVFQDLMEFTVRMSGPIGSPDDVYPELVSQLSVREGVIPGFSGLSFDAYYNKFELRDYDDLVDPENALVGARVNVRSGPVVISLIYDLRYDPYPASGDNWIVTSRLESAIALR